MECGQAHCTDDRIASFLMGYGRQDAVEHHAVCIRESRAILEHLGNKRWPVSACLTLIVVPAPGVEPGKPTEWARLPLLVSLVVKLRLPTPPDSAFAPNLSHIGAVPCDCRATALASFPRFF